MAEDIRPADITQAKPDPEQVVIAWIGQETNPPVHLSEIVSHYRNLVAYAGQVEVSVAEAASAIDEADTMFDRLLAAAAESIAVSTQAEAQLRRIRRREEQKQLAAVAKMGYQERCNWAIEQWRKGVRA